MKKFAQFIECDITSILFHFILIECLPVIANFQPFEINFYRIPSIENFQQFEIENLLLIHNLFILTLNLKCIQTIIISL